MTQLPPRSGNSLPPEEAKPKKAFAIFDLLFRLACQGAGGIVILIALGLLATLVYQSWPVLTKLGEYQIFSTSEWDPGKKIYGAWVFIYGTLATSAIAMVVAVPLGVGAAAYLSEIAPANVRRVCTFLIELLASIPSVVYGFWGYVFLAPVLRWGFSLIGVQSNTSGQGILAAGLMLAIMIVPYITAISFDVCRAVPAAQRQGSLALGASRWQTIWKVVLPYALPGIIAACFLALGRALGETMAVTMLIGNVRYLEVSLTGGGDSIASIIANSLNEAGSQSERSALVTMGLILLLITAVVNILARVIITRMTGLKRKPGPIGRLIAKINPFGKNKDVTLTSTENTKHERLVVSDSAYRSIVRKDKIMTGVMFACMLATVIPLFLILGYITYRGVGSVDMNLFVKQANGKPGQTGLGHAMVGTVTMVLMASVFAIPIGIMAAVYLNEFRTHWFTKPVRFIAEVLGGVPSIVIGIYVYAIMVRPMWTTDPWGNSAWAGAFSLLILMIPVTVRGAEEAMRLVPGSLRQASYALGASQSQTVFRIIIPAALPAITTGILLAMGRVAGETAPLRLTAGDSNYWPQPLIPNVKAIPSGESLTEKFPFITNYIYEYSKNPEADLIRQAWGGAFVLLSFVMLLNLAIRLAAGKRLVSAARAD